MLINYQITKVTTKKGGGEWKEKRAMVGGRMCAK